jgi:hypothetical protein
MSTITIKVSGSMVKYIKDIIPKDYEVKLIKLTDREFRFMVDYDEYSNDVDYGVDNMYRVIQVLYPYEYYAMPKYLTTKDLTRIYKNSVKYGVDFNKELISEIEV